MRTKALTHANLALCTDHRMESGSGEVKKLRTPDAHTLNQSGLTSSARRSAAAADAGLGSGAAEDPIRRNCLPSLLDPHAIISLLWVGDHGENEGAGGAGDGRRDEDAGEWIRSHLTLPEAATLSCCMAVVRLAPGVPVMVSAPRGMRHTSSFPHC